MAVKGSWCFFERSYEVLSNLIQCEHDILESGEVVDRALASLVEGSSSALSLTVEGNIPDFLGFMVIFRNMGEFDSMVILLPLQFQC